MREVIIIFDINLFPMKSLFTLFCILFYTCAFSQPYLKKPSGNNNSFKEVQKQFAEWSENKNLKNEKGWKYFKRWEMDMQFHTDANGEAANPSIYIDEAIKYANGKLLAKSASVSWYPVGPNILPLNETGYMENGLGRINCIAFHPTLSSTYYVGVAQGGVWKTSNNGQSWMPLTDNLPITRISDIAIDPNNPDTMYISVCDFEYIGIGLKLNGRKRNTHYGLGVFKTVDGGASWNPTGLSFQLTDGDASLIRKIIVNKTNSNKLVAAGANGMYTSADGGTTWTKKLDSLFWDLTQDPVNENILYAASGWILNANDGNAAIYKSSDFGNTWSLLNTGIPSTGIVQRVKIAVAPSNNNYIYALTVNTQGGLSNIYKSTDAGTTWTYNYPGNILEHFDGNGSGGQGNYDLALLVNSQNENIVYVGGINIWKSTDGAQTFDPVSHWKLDYGPTLHGDIHFIETHPITGEIFACSDGGVYKTSDVVSQPWSNATSGTPWPTSWMNISDGLAITAFYRISSSRNASDKIIAGAQDNATAYYNGNSWTTIFGGDGMDNYIDPISGRIIGSSQYGNFYGSDDEGSSVMWLDPNVINENAEWTSPIIADYNQSGILYSGFENVSASINAGFSWDYISNFGTSNEISALAVANSNSSVIYAAKRVRYELGIPGSLHKTTDAGSSWINITSNLPDNLYYTSVEISEKDENTAYITMAGFSAGNKVFKTIDGGFNWTNVSYNLPNVPVNCIKYIPKSNGDVMLATDLGIYILKSGTTTWENNSLGLPNVIISDLEFNVAANKVYASTFGRGIWAADMDFNISTNDIAVKPLNIEVYPTVNNGSFTIELTGNITFNDKLNIDIIDVTGKIVHSSVSSSQKVFKYQLNLPSGLYFAKIKGKNAGGVKRFIIQ